jgi:outer membrane protein TolC
MMRWKQLSGVLTLVLLFSGGCKQRCFLTEADFNRTTTTLLEGLDQRPDLGSTPLTASIGAPPTLDNLDRKIRFVSLAECVAIALEQGRVGQPSLLFPGSGQDNLVSFNGRGIGGSDAIRVFALNPAQSGADIEASMTKFDAVFTSAMTWNTTDQPIGTALQNFQANQQINSINQQEATFNAALLKPLATGGVAGVTFNMPYQLTNLQARVNPSYRPTVQFQFEQPLLQGFGVEINQLRASHPGSVLSPGTINTAPTAEGILISRLRFDQSRAQFESQVNQMLLNVETAYWNLYGSYWTVYSREQGLRFAYESFKLTQAKYEGGRAKAADFYESLGQYEQFRAQRIEAINTLLENERQLRLLVGLEAEDGTRLMPSDSPTLSPYRPDWQQAEQDALAKRPELSLARQEIKAAQMRLLLAKNQIMPDLRLTATYDFNGLGTRLDGSQTPTPGDNGFRDINAFRNLSEGNFSNWAVGLRFSMPLGYRLGYTQIRQAQLQLSQTIETLVEQEAKAKLYLGNFYRRLSTNYKLIQANRAAREASGQQLRARFEEYRAGKETLEFLLRAQREWADALANEYRSVVDYNNALIGFEFAKGTIQQHNNVHIAEGPVPQCAAVRARDHEEAKTAALVLRERAIPKNVSPLHQGPVHLHGMAPSLPGALAAQPMLKEVPQAVGGNLPSPVDMNKDEIFRPREEQKLPGPREKMPEGQPSSGAKTSQGQLPLPKPVEPQKPAAKPKKPSDQFGIERDE